MNLLFALLIVPYFFSNPLLAANVNSEDLLATIDSIADKSTTTIQASDGTTRNAARGDQLKPGEKISTDGETVTLVLSKAEFKHSGELQIGPHSVMSFQNNIFNLESGIIWILAAAGHSLADPLYLKTPQAGLAIPATNAIIESLPNAKSVSIAVLEGSIKAAAPSLNELSVPQKATYISASFRSKAADSKIELPQKFKRHLLIAYVAHKSKAMAQDMTNRGSRVLQVLSQKNQKHMTKETDIIWNNVQSRPIEQGKVQDFSRPQDFGRMQESGNGMNSSNAMPLNGQDTKNR